jgi:hypothetical protein
LTVCSPMDGFPGAYSTSFETGLECSCSWGAVGGGVIGACIGADPLCVFSAFPQDWGTKGVENGGDGGHSPPLTEADLMRTGSDPSPLVLSRITGGLCFANVTRRGVQRGEAPLRFSSTPHDWGTKGVDRASFRDFRRWTGNVVTRRVLGPLGVCWPPRWGAC